MQGRQQRNKMKTLCTIDTTDIDLQDTKAPSRLKTQTNKSNYKYAQSPCIGTKKTNHNKLYTPAKIEKTKQKFFRTQNFQSRSQSKYKAKSVLHQNSQKSKQRIKTDHSILNEFNIKSLLSVSAKSKKNKYNNQFEQNYQMDTYEIIQKLSSDSKQNIYLAKKYDKYYLMKKTKNGEVKKQYQNQGMIKSRLSHIKWKNLLKLVRIYNQKSWMYAIWEYYGQCLSWQNQSHNQIISKVLKHQGAILKNIIKQLSKGINELNAKGFAHNNVRFENVCLKIQQLKKSIKIEGNVKLYNLGRSFCFKDKNKLMEMAEDIYSPPEVINLKLFERGQKFDRELIQYINYYDQPWYIDVWALGILILELIAAESISIEKAQLPSSQNSDDVSIQLQEQQQKIYNRKQQTQNKKMTRQITLTDILEAQKSLLIQTQSQIQKLSFNKKLQSLVLRMLSVNPLSRPSPKQIIKEL